MSLSEPEPGAKPSQRRPARWQWILSAALSLALAVVVVRRPALGGADHGILDALSSLFLNPDQAGTTSWLALLGPSALALVMAVMVAALPQRPWSKLLTLLVLVGVALRYLFWRASTIDHSSSQASTIGTLMLVVEILYLFTQGLALVPAPLFDPWRRRRQADQLESDNPDNHPSVEIWIRTAHEEERLIRRALIACRLIHYPAISICVVDRIGRDSVRNLAKSMGARYIDPSKAGAFTGLGGDPLMLAALDSGNSELIAVFESGYMPFANFLKRTTGFLTDKRVAMVQTPLTHFRSEFYNRNIGSDQVMPGERDIFFHYGEVVLDRFNSVQACEGSYLIRRQALRSMLQAGSRAVGWESLGTAELQRQGQKIVYLDEIVSIGEAPRTFTAFLQQQLRHRQEQLLIAIHGGTAPLGQGLAPLQVGYRVSQLLDQLTPLLRIGFIVIPLLALLFGVPLIKATVSDYIVYGTPLIILLHTLPAWLTNNHFSRFWKEVSEALTAVPALAGVIRLVIHRGGPTRHPGLDDEIPANQSINLGLAWPFLLALGELITILFLRYVLPLIPGFDQLLNPGYLGESLLLIWNLHNGWVMIVCLICSIDQPVRRQGDRVPIHRSGRLELGAFRGGGVTCDLSESGAAFLLNAGVPSPAESSGWLLLDDTDLKLPVEVVRRSGEGANVRIGLRYSSLDPASTGALLKLLYGGGVGLPQARQIGAIHAFISLIGGLWGANPVVRRY
jgi:cellulose synthase (UDP-forming)